VAQRDCISRHGAPPAPRGEERPLLKVISTAVELLLGGEGIDGWARGLLWRLGEATDVSRAYLFENEAGPDGEILTTQVYEWVAPGVVPQIDNPGLHRISYRAAGFGRWAECLGRGEPISGLVRQLPPSEMGLLESQQIRSLAVVPVTTHAGWWGFIGFDDCVREREWSTLELDALKIAANVIGAAIEQERARRELQSAHDALEERVRERSEQLTHAIHALEGSEAKAREQVAELEHLYRTAPIGLGLLDRHLCFIRVNQRLADLNGHPVERHLGRRMSEVDPDRAGPFEALCGSVIETGEAVIDREIEAGTPEASRTHLVSCYPLLAADGTVRAISAVVHDITEHRQAEEERRKLEVRLEETRKIESLGILAGGVAHDFNNLLVSMLGNADLAAEELPPNSPARPYLREISAAAGRAAELTQQLLEYAGKGRFASAPLDLSLVAREAVEQLRYAIPRDVTLRDELASALPAIQADRTAIRQVVVHLITNAAESIADGHGRITLRSGWMTPSQAYLASEAMPAEVMAGDYAYLEVEDNGCGMDEEVRKRVFEPFFTTKFTGRGLGLAATLGIVRGHRGVIRIHSRPGEGTRIQVLFPCFWTGAEERSQKQEASSRKR
jgi:PAS domain S-box-containing protein